jgi:predicted hydrocarbon binding protein
MVKNVLIEELEQEVGRCARLLKNGKAFIMRLVTFTDFKKCLEETFGSGASVIFYEVGRGCGRRSCNRLLRKYSDREKLLKALTRYKYNEKWGKIRFKLDMKSGVGKILITESFEAKQYGQSTEPVCYFLRGYLKGFLTQTFKKPLKVTEIACIAQGNKTCEFKVEES